MANTETVTLTCDEGHEFKSRVKAGGVTDCPTCRRAGTRTRVHRPAEPRERPRIVPLPGPDEDDDPFDIDDGSLPPELVAELDALEDAEPDEPGDAETPPEGPAEPAHPLPGFLRDRQRSTPKRGPAPKIRITAGVRKDIEAKIRFVAVPAAQMWRVRDPICGSVAVEQEPEASAALAEIICDSPDLVAWFTGPAGGFMKYFRLAMALQPVAMMVWAHHILHAVIEPDANWNGQPAPDYSAYPA